MFGTDMEIENYFNVESIPDYCTKENLERVYNKYIDNLKTLNLKMIWIDILDLPPVEKINWKTAGDAYLKDTDYDWIQLGFDIMENGTYWPVFLSAGDTGYKVRDGLHRVYALQLLAKKGLWKKKVLAATDEKRDPPDKEKVYYIPAPEMVTERFKQRYSLFYNEEKKEEIKYFDDFFIEYRTTSGYLCPMMLSYLLRNAFYEYKQKNGVIIKPGKVINNYEDWEKWYLH